VRVGVVSDTHDHLANVAEIVRLLNRAGVERVVHTGDITRACTLEVLSRLDAPLVGVFGNNDRERDALEEAATRLGFQLADPPLELAWAERRPLVVHDPLDLEDLARLEPEIHRF
jgi:predicted phosphodiesterase